MRLLRGHSEVASGWFHIFQFRFLSLSCHPTPLIDQPVVKVVTATSNLISTFVFNLHFPLSFLFILLSLMLILTKNRKQHFLALSSRADPKIMQTLLSFRGAAIAQWIRLRLPSCRPGFESQAHHLCFFQFILFKLYVCHLNWNVKRTKNKQKEAGVGPFFKKHSSAIWSLLYVELTSYFSEKISTLCSTTR